MSLNMFVSYFFIVLMALAAYASAAPATSLQSSSDSPIRIISIRPAVRRNTRRMHMPTSHTPSGNDPVFHVGKFNVLPAQTVESRTLKPTPILRMLKEKIEQLTTSSPPAKAADKPANLFTSKSLQGGAWVKVVPGKYPESTRYFAVARANGLFQEHSIRAYPAKRGFVFKN